MTEFLRSTSRDDHLSDRPLTISQVRAHPLSVKLAVPQKSAKGAHQVSEILVVEVETADGIVGIGEGFAD